MTSRVTCTEAQMRRAIRAALKEGVSIAGMNVRNGIIIYGEPPSLVSPADQDDEWTNPAKWNKPGTK